MFPGGSPDSPSAMSEHSGACSSRLGRNALSLGIMMVMMTELQTQPSLKLNTSGHPTRRPRHWVSSNLKPRHLQRSSSLSSVQFSSHAHSFNAIWLTAKLSRTASRRSSAHSSFSSLEPISSLTILQLLPDALVSHKV